MTHDNLSNHYTGKNAQDYEAKRITSEKWHREQRSARDLLNQVELPERPTILDVPVGTGRFLSLYQELDAQVMGIDISSDMLSQAEQAAKRLEYEHVSFDQGDARRLPLRDASVDLAVCIRLLNWMVLDDVQQVVAELSRVSRRHMIIGVRTLTTSRTELKAMTTRLAQNVARHSIKRKRPHTIKHRASQLTGIFDRLGIAIAHKELIERGRDGSAYDFYLLYKTM